MNLCCDNHDEICFEGADCPLCAIAVDIKDLEAQVADLEKQVGRLQNENDSMQDELLKDPTIRWIEAHQKTVDKPDNT